MSLAFMTDNTGLQLIGDHVTKENCPLDSFWHFLDMSALAVFAEDWSYEGCGGSAKLADHSVTSSKLVEELFSVKITGFEASNTDFKKNFEILGSGLPLLLEQVNDYSNLRVLLEKETIIPSDERAQNNQKIITEAFDQYLLAQKPSGGFWYDIGKQLPFQDPRFKALIEVCANSSNLQEVLKEYLKKHDQLDRRWDQTDTQILDLLVRSHLNSFLARSYHNSHKSVYIPSFLRSRLISHHFGKNPIVSVLRELEKKL